MTRGNLSLLTRFLTQIERVLNVNNLHPVSTGVVEAARAINDQPITLKLAVGGEKRDDLPGVPDRWGFVFDAGLRFNLWAPPRSRS